MHIDAHQHFWNYDPAKHSWMSDEMGAIKQDFSPVMLWEQLSQCEIDGCVAVQADQSEAETEFLVKLAQENNFIKAVVGWVDLRSKDISSRLKHFSAQSIIKGFRHVIQDEPDLDFVLGEAFKRGIAALSEFNFTYDLLVFPDQLPASIKLVEEFPDQPFVLDHIAKPLIKQKSIGDWEVHIRDLASHPNVYCKISGMVTEADWERWEYQDFIPFLDIIFDAFGAKHIMYGSDWPVCLVAAEYKDMKSIVDKYISELDTEDVEAIMGENAIQFYNIEKS